MTSVPNPADKEKRHLVRWNDDLDKALLLQIHAVCGEKGVKIPYKEVAVAMGAAFTEGSITQHIAKLRLLMDPNEVPVPGPPSKKGRMAKQPSAVYTAKSRGGSASTKTKLVPKSITSSASSNAMKRKAATRSRVTPARASRHVKRSTSDIDSSDENNVEAYVDGFKYGPNAKRFRTVEANSNHRYALASTPISPSNMDEMYAQLTGIDDILDGANASQSIPTSDISLPHSYPSLQLDHVQGHNPFTFPLPLDQIQAQQNFIYPHPTFSTRPNGFETYPVSFHNADEEEEEEEEEVMGRIAPSIEFRGNSLTNSVPSLYTPSTYSYDQSFASNINTFAPFNGNNVSRSPEASISPTSKVRTQSPQNNSHSSGQLNNRNSISSTMGPNMQPVMRLSRNYNASPSQRVDLGNWSQANYSSNNDPFNPLPMPNISAFDVPTANPYASAESSQTTTRNNSMVSHANSYGSYGGIPTIQGLHTGDGRTSREFPMPQPPYKLQKFNTNASTVDDYSGSQEFTTAGDCDIFNHNIYQFPLPLMEQNDFMEEFGYGAHETSTVLKKDAVPMDAWAEPLCEW